MNIHEITNESDRTKACKDLALDYIQILRSRADNAEDLRKLPPDTVREIKTKGFSRLCQPIKYDGLQLPLDSAVDIISILARGCASTSWVCAVYGDHAILANKLEKKVADEIWLDNPMATISASVSPTGKAEKISGGFKVSGKWGWVSGCDTSDWFFVGAFLEDINKKKVHHLFLIPRQDVAIEDNWHVLGMSGTGSKNITISESFVPHHRVISMDNANSGISGVNTNETTPLYRLPWASSAPFLFTGVILGITESLLENITKQLSKQKSMGVSLSQLQSMQIHISEVSAEIDCARLLIMRDTFGSMSTMRENQTLTMDERARNRRDMAYAGKLCKSAADQLIEMAGGSGVFDTNIVQRKYRDLQVAMRHIALSWDLAATTCGEIMFGLKPTSHLI